jgi:Baseplate J-like protein
MTIPNPSLDNKPFHEIVEEARKKIQAYSKLWTDHNASDPGITFIELFAWLAETQIYSLNKIPERHYLKFLKLLDVKPRLKPAMPSKLYLTFNGAGDNVIELPKGTQIRPIDIDGRGDLAFDIDEQILVVPLQIYKIATLSRRGLIELTSVTSLNIGFFYAFSDSPLAGNSSLYIGFDTLKDKGTLDNLHGKEVTLSIFPYEEDLPSIGSHGSEESMIRLSNRIVWEYLGSVMDGGSSPATRRLEWQSLNLTEDSTNALTSAGRISFSFPFREDDRYQISELDRQDNGGGGTDGRDAQGQNKPLFWIRCRLVENHYEVAPRIQAILLNTTLATYGWEARERYSGNGLPDQIIRLSEHEKKLIFKIIEVKTINENEMNRGGGGEGERSEGLVWKEVDDLDASGPEDADFECVLSRGTVTFGDNIHGIAPQIGDRIWITYRFGNPDELGIVPAGTTFRTVKEKENEDDIVVDDSEPSVEATNYFPSSKVEQPELITMAMARMRSELRIPFKAVSSDDFEYIAKNTPGLRVSRAKAFSSISDENTVIVIAVPFSFDKTPKPSKGFLDTICHHLDSHRLITTRLKVKEPQYVGIYVNATITVKPAADPESIREMIVETLDSFLNPISRRPGQNAWPFGRNVYKSEVISTIENVEGVDCVVDLFLAGSGAPGNFENRGGDVLIYNFSLVYLKGYSLQIMPPGAECRMEEKK